MIVLAGCTTAVVSPAPSRQPHLCGRLSAERCAQVIEAVADQVPENRRSTIAVADFATLGPQPSNGSGRYLVSFAPIPNEDVWLSPPTWTVTGTPGAWTVTPVADIVSLNVCYIDLLRQAGLTDYAPTYPSGVCG
jgi:hypothetical protein